MKEDHRVLLTNAAFNALKAESLVRQSNLKDTLETLILENISPNARNILSYLETPAVNAVPVVNATNATNAPKPDKPKKQQPRLFENPEALQKIKELWATDPRPSYAEISKQINYPRATVAENIKRMKDKGDLPD